MRVLFALPGLHKYDRGAEIAFIAIARELAKAGDEVTLIGSGAPRPRAIPVRACGQHRPRTLRRVPVAAGAAQRHGL